MCRICAPYWLQYVTGERGVGRGREKEMGREWNKKNEGGRVGRRRERGRRKRGRGSRRGGRECLMEM